MAPWRTVVEMAGPTPYILFAGTARQALTFYADVFGGSVQLHTFEEFYRSDGPPDAIAHGHLSEGPVALYAADAAEGELPIRSEGIMLSLLGTVSPAELERWFGRLCEGGHVVDQLQARQWGASDGRVIDRFGVQWLIGFEH